MNFEVRNKRAVKIIVIGLAVLAVLVILGLGVKKKEKELSEEEMILMSLTAPPGAASEVSQEVISSLTAKTKKEPVSEDVLKNLTAP